MEKPLFTIVTATYNAASTLGTLLESCAKQTYQNFELIIQDGASSDNTLAIAHAFSDRILQLKIFSEPDTGIYDAWNKALKHVTGSWVIFLGADDSLLKDSVLQEFSLWAKQEQSSCFCSCSCCVCNEKNEILRIISGAAQGAVKSLRAASMPFPFPSLFIRADVFKENQFNPRFKIAGDYEFLCRALKADAQLAKLSLISTCMSDGGVSSNPARASEVFKETVDCAQLNFGDAWNSERTAQYKRSVIVSKIYNIFGKNLGTKIYNILRLLRKKIPIRLSPLNALELKRLDELSKDNIPIFVISFNRLEFLKKQLAWLEKRGFKNIIIVDNNSNYPPLLEYFEQTHFNVHRLKENFGHLAVWKCGDFEQILKNAYYVVTDPDILPDDNCPDDFIYVFYNLLQKYPGITKAGFSLRIDDIPDHYSLKGEVIKWEKKFWEKYIQEDNAFVADLDTSFALYRPGDPLKVSSDDWLSAIRTNFPYTAQHLPWYINSANLSEEEKKYQQNILINSSHWSISDPQALKEENMRLQQRIRHLEAEVDLLSKSWPNKLSLVFFKILRQLKQVFTKH